MKKTVVEARLGAPLPLAQLNEMRCYRRGSSRPESDWSSRSSHRLQATNSATGTTTIATEISAGMIASQGCRVFRQRWRPPAPRQAGSHKVTATTPRNHQRPLAACATIQSNRKNAAKLTTAWIPKTIESIHVPQVRTAAVTPYLPQICRGSMYASWNLQRREPPRSCCGVSSQVRCSFRHDPTRPSRKCSTPF